MLKRKKYEQNAEAFQNCKYLVEFFIFHANVELMSVYKLEFCLVTLVIAIKWSLVWAFWVRSVSIEHLELLEGPFQFQQLLLVENMKSFLLIGVIYGLCALSASAWECSFNGRRKVLQVGAPDAAPPQQLEAPSPSAPSSPPLPPQSTVATRPTGADVHGEPPLDYDFYTKSCPSFQQIVKTQVARAILADSLTPAKLLRLFFHDCFVMGCDASLLLNSTVVNLAERDHANNFTVDKYSVIDSIKAELEKACQAIVSCADTLGAAAAEAVEQVRVHDCPILLLELYPRRIRSWTIMA